MPIPVPQRSMLGLPDDALLLLTPDELTDILRKENLPVATSNGLLYRRVAKDEQTNWSKQGHIYMQRRDGVLLPHNGHLHLHHPEDMFLRYDVEITGAVYERIPVGKNTVVYDSTLYFAPGAFAPVQFSKQRKGRR